MANYDYLDRLTDRLFRILLMMRHQLLTELDAIKTWRTKSWWFNWGPYREPVSGQEYAKRLREDNEILGEIMKGGNLTPDSLLTMIGDILHIVFKVPKLRTRLIRNGARIRALRRRRVIIREHPGVQEEERYYK